jgi:hypothetical protein
MTEMQEVEVPAAPETDESTETEPTTDSTATTTTTAAPKAKRAKLPEGYGTPIQFNAALTEYLRAKGELAEDAEHRPQVIYSYINNRSKDDPFPVHYVTEAGEEREEKSDDTRPGLTIAGDETHEKFAEAFAWWERKEERVQNRKANAAKKAAEKAAKPAATPAGTDEAPSELAEVEEAE